MPKLPRGSKRRAIKVLRLRLIDRAGASRRDAVGARSGVSRPRECNSRIPGDFEMNLAELKIRLTCSRGKKFAETPGGETEFKNSSSGALPA